MKKTQAKRNRENYLTMACAMVLDELEPFANKLSLSRPAYRVSVGWPKGVRAGNRALAQCFKREMSDDGVNEIYVTPNESDPAVILPALVHECIHAYLDNADGHRGRFVTLAKAIGLEGAMTEAHPSDALVVKLEAIEDVLGDYPHATLNDELRKKQTTRMIKFYCNECGFIARTSARWIDLIMGSMCPACNEHDLTSD